MADGRRSIACRAEDRAIIGQLWANASSVRKGELTAKTAKKKTAGKPNGAFMKPMTPSPALAEGSVPNRYRRTEVTQKLWVYVKKNGLQDAKNRRMINADPALKTVFGVKSIVSMFEMTKLVGKHLQ
jgi:chromatin remodeling complex protein RSC6